MEMWRKVWRDGIALQLSDDGLEALRQALLSDDERLIQEATCSPPPLIWTQDRPCEAACAISLPGWLGDGLTTVGKVEERFGQLCYQADLVLGEPAACRHFINWFDSVPRDEARLGLLAEVERELSNRQRLFNLLAGKDFYCPVCHGGNCREDWTCPYSLAETGKAVAVAG